MATPNGNGFIGHENLQHIADKFSPTIIMGAAYFRPAEFSRLRIKISSGLQFKDTITVFNRKGGLTRRKVVDNVKTVDKIGYLQERVLTGYQTILRAKDNQDNYRESPVVSVNGDATPAYPMSEAAFLACTQTYGEDLFACLFYGDAESTDENMNLYDGFITNLNKDVTAGNISKDKGNLISIDAITKPTSETDQAAYDAFEKFYAGWSQNLQNAEEVDVHCSIAAGAAIAGAYKNSWSSNKGVNRVTSGTDKGNFTIDEYPNVIFIPSAEFGKGDKLMAILPFTLEYGVNSTDSSNKIFVQSGTSDEDATIIYFQMQSIQGTRIRKVSKADICITDGTIAVGDIPQGDYTKETFAVMSNDATLGAAAIGDTNKSADGVYAKGVTLTLTATPTATGEFVRWSDGNTNVSREYITKGIPDAVMAIFKAKA